MVEKENRFPLFKLFSELSAPWYSGAKKVVTGYIDTSENLAKGALDLQQQTTGWAKDTPWAPLFEAQTTMARQFVESSAAMARGLWQIEKEGEAKREPRDSV